MLFKNHLTGTLSVIPLELVQEVYSTEDDFAKHTRGDWRLECCNSNDPYHRLEFRLRSHCGQKVHVKLEGLHRVWSSRAAFVIHRERRGKGCARCLGRRWRWRQYLR